MTSTLAGWLVGLSESRLAMILAGMTITIAGVLACLRFARRSRASVRHLLLLSAFAVLAVLPVASVLIPSIQIAVPVATSDAASGAPALPAEPMDQIVPIVGESVPAAPVQPTIAISGTAVVTAVWALGAAICCMPIMFGLVEMRSLRRSATSWTEAGAEVFLHPSISGPVTFGIVRPVIVLPDDARRWPHADLMRALVHEREHVRRWDWLSQCLARVLCAVYWFHPLVWVARRRLDLEAERACDDAVLRYESQRDDADATAYADQLVLLARRLSSARPPILAMANRADLAARVGALLDARQRRGRAGLLAVVFSTAAAALLIAMMASFKLVAAPQSMTDAQAPAFEVASIKPCAPGETGMPTGGRGAGAAPTTSPGRLTIQCTTVVNLINRAYVTFGSPPPLNHPNGTDSSIVQGGPAWASTDRYAIEAKAENAQDVTTLNGPMLRRLLVERFQLKIHEDLKDVPALALTVAPGGAKVKAVDPASCIESTPNNSGPRVLRTTASGTPAVYAPDAGPDAKPYCTAGVSPKPPNVAIDITGLPFDRIVRTLSSIIGDRPVIDQTGLTGQFSFHVEFAADENVRVFPRMPETELPSGPSIFAAFEKQLGLKLVPTRAPQASLVIDRLERPIDPPSPGASQKFDVVSIKPCDAQNPPLPPQGAGSRQGGGGVVQTTPDRLSVNCATVQRLVATAYVINGEALLNNLPANDPDKQFHWIKNMPDWAETETYAIEAKASQAVDKAVLLGPMLRALLEDRFKLKLHRDREEVPMYALVVAKTGMKMKPMDPDGCLPFDAAAPPRTLEDQRAFIDELQRGGKPRCGSLTFLDGSFQGSRRWIIGGNTMEQFARTLSNSMDRFVIDKTGVTDRFNIRIEFAPDEHTIGSVARRPEAETPPSPQGPTMFKALEEQLGLKLEPTKDQRGFLVIDQIQRPTPDGVLVRRRQS